MIALLGLSPVDVFGLAFVGLLAAIVATGGPR